MRRGPLGKRLEQTVEIADLEAPRRFALHVADGPFPFDGAYELSDADGGGTEATFTGSTGARGPMRLLLPLARRQMAAHHRRLRDLLAA